MATAALGLIAASLAGGQGSPGPGAPGWEALRDSMLALPDSAWDVADTPGLDRKKVIELMRRMYRAPESLYVGPDAAHRSDAEMKRTFLAHRTEFDRLIRMFEADSIVDFVEDPTWIGIYERPTPLSAARRKEYLRLFEITGVRMLVRASRDLILLRTTTVHTFDRRGYAYMKRGPRPGDVIVDQETTTRHELCVYRRLGGLWFIYYQEMT